MAKGTDRTVRPSGLCNGNRVRTRTARRTSPLRTFWILEVEAADEEGEDAAMEIGRALLMTTTISSPREDWSFHMSACEWYGWSRMFTNRPSPSLGRSWLSGR